jgi:hypothetical protein
MPDIDPIFSYWKKFRGLEYVSPEVLNPTNHVLVMIDWEGPMAARCWLMELRT